MPKLKQLFLTPSDLRAFFSKNAAEIKRLYWKEELSARRVADRLNVKYSSFFSSVLSRMYPRLVPVKESVKGVREILAAREVEVKRLYLEESLTAQETAEALELPFSKSFARLLSTMYPRTEGKRGGARVGSGNKKGITFCRKCRKKKTDGHVCPRR